MEIVADVSVFLAVVLNEDSRSQVESKTAGHRLVAPNCLHWEVGNALYNSIKRGNISEDVALQAYSSFCDVPVQLVDVDISASLRIAAKHKIPAYDAYYLQCALVRKREIITLDERMKRVAKELSVSVL